MFNDAAVWRWAQGVSIWVVGRRECGVGAFSGVTKTIVCVGEANRVTHLETIKALKEAPACGSGATGWCATVAPYSSKGGWHC